MDLTAEAIEKIAELGVQSAALHPIGEGLFYRLGGDGRTEIVNLNTDDYRDFPKRIIGTTAFTDLASFLTYWDIHHDNASLVFAPQRPDSSGAYTLTTVIDAHHSSSAVHDPARWQQHRATCTLNLSDALILWLNASDKLGTQEWFTTFLDENMVYIVDPAGADLKEMVSSIEVSASASFSGKVNLQSGARVLSYTEDVDGTMKGGTVAIPKTITVALPMWRGDRDPAEYVAFQGSFKYRLAGGKLTIGYKLIRPQDQIDAAYATIIEKVTTHIGRAVLMGTPPRT